MPELKNKKILITAGPTYEPIDPVRFIGNRSTGKMGISIADAFADNYAEVTLILGPSLYRPENINIKTIIIETADEMYAACLKFAENSDVIIMSAAVADYKVKEVSNQKIKKIENSISLDLIKNVDILYELGKIKTHQFLVGFALETENLIDNAKAKLKKKNLDLIIANTTNKSGEGFGYDTNKICIIDKDNKIVNFELKQKREVAKDICNIIATYLKLK
jgi:phosphopantothenoylcysteine decarboxylase/phosphopantothenate--cysteine ligase